MIQALNFIKNAELIKILDSNDQSFQPSYLFRNWNFFVNQTVSEFVYLDRCGSDDVVAFVRREVPRTIYLCANIISEEHFTSFDLVATILHEVRHLSGPSHVECIQGQRKNQKACDESIDIQGSYAFSLWAYVQMAYGAKNLHPVTRLLARANADILLQNNFNRLPRIETVKILVGVTDQGHLFKLENEDIVLMNFALNKTGSIYILNNFWYLLSKHDFQIQTIFNPFINMKQLSQIYQDDLNFSVNKLNLKLIDFYKNQQIVGLLEKNKLTIVCPNKNFEFKNSKFVSFILSDHYKNDSLHLLRNDGFIETFYCEEGRFDRIPYDSDAVKNTIRIVKFNNREFALNHRGELFSRSRLSSGGYSQWFILNKNGPKIQSIQLYDSKSYLDQLQLDND